MLISMVVSNPSVDSKLAVSFYMFSTLARRVVAATARNTWDETLKKQLISKI